MARDNRTPSRSTTMAVDPSANSSAAAMTPVFQVGNSPHYRRVKMLGKGGYGNVYVCMADDEAELATLFPNRHQRDLHRHVAAKIQSFTGRGAGPAQRELDALSALNGTPGIPRLLYAGATVDGSHHLIIMELLGPSLRDLVPRAHSMPDTRLFEIAVQCLRILRAMHDRGFIHGDVKPRNILTAPSSRRQIYLLDFGFAARWRRATYLQRPGKFGGGTAKYASEHTLLGRTPSRRDDLISLAYTLLSLRHGSLPWDRVTSHHQLCKAKVDRSLSPPKFRVKEHDPLQWLIVYSHGLSFHEDPDYDSLIGMFLLGVAAMNRVIRAVSFRSSPFAEPSASPTGGRQWIAIFDRRSPVAPSRVLLLDTADPPTVRRGVRAARREGYTVRNVGACSSGTCAVIMERATAGDRGPPDQKVRIRDDIRLPEDWIAEQRDKGYFISAMCGDGRGDGAIVVLTRGLPYVSQRFKASVGFPWEWVATLTQRNYYVTSLAAGKPGVWAVVMSKRRSSSQPPQVAPSASAWEPAPAQMMEMDFKFPLEGLRHAWTQGLRLTCVAGNSDQIALVCSAAEENGVGGGAAVAEQVVVVSNEYPRRWVEEASSRGLNILTICSGRTCLSSPGFRILVTCNNRFLLNSLDSHPPAASSLRRL